jgi:hypothetical protein
VNQAVVIGFFELEITMNTDSDLILLGLVAIGIVGIITGLTAVAGGTLHIRVLWRRFRIELNLRKETMWKGVKNNRP